MRALRRPNAWVIVATMITTLAPITAFAVVNIRHEAWVMPSDIRRDIVAPPDSSSVLAFEFEAELTPLDRDPAGGVTFYLTERDAGIGDGDQLFKLVLPCASLPPVGSPVHGWAVVRVACNAIGQLQPRGVIQYELAGCGTTGPFGCTSLGAGRSSILGSSDPEAFEFTLQDENLMDGSTPTTEDAVGCRPLAFGGLEPLEDLTARRPVRGLASQPIGSLGVYFDPGGTTCSRQVTPFEPFDLYILAKTAGISACGITGAEFRVLGFPAEWFPTATPPPPGSFVLGEPFGNGVNIAFSTCQMNDTDVVQLLHYVVFPTTAVTNHALSIVARNPPSNASHPWPLFVLCAAPVYAVTRVDAVNAILNPTMPAPCDKVVGVTPATWTVVKDLFR